MNRCARRKEISSSSLFVSLSLLQNLRNFLSPIMHVSLFKARFKVLRVSTRVLWYSILHFILAVVESFIHIGSQVRFFTKCQAFFCDIQSGSNGRTIHLLVVVTWLWFVHFFHHLLMQQFWIFCLACVMLKFGFEADPWSNFALEGGFVQLRRSKLHRANRGVIYRFVSPAFNPRSFWIGLRI